MKKISVCCTLFLLAFFPLSVLSHHSFISQFDPAKEVVMNGTVARVRWTNPHAFFDVTVVNESGVEELWAFELGSPNTLIRYGWWHSHTGRVLLS